MQCWLNADVFGDLEQAGQLGCPLVVVAEAGVIREQTQFGFAERVSAAKAKEISAWGRLPEGMRVIGYQAESIRNMLLRVCPQRTRRLDGVHAAAKSVIAAVVLVSALADHEQSVGTGAEAEHVFTTP